MNMVRRVFIFAAFSFVSGLVLTAGSAMAETSPSSMSDQQLTQIRNRCNEVQAALSRVHANDALLRVNRGQIYERLSTKLMVPLNSRIALNRLDGSSLLGVTSSYEQHLSDFRLRYQAYEEQLSKTMKIDCKKQPARFYESLQAAREQRQNVHEAVQNLAGDITEYRQMFTNFARSYKEIN